MANENIWLDTDNLIHVESLKNMVTGAYINDATITATLYDSDDVAVTGASSISVAYVASSLGEYAGVFADTISLTEGDEYDAEITIIGDTFQTKYRLPLTAAYKED